MNFDPHDEGRWIDSERAADMMKVSRRHAMRMLDPSGMRRVLPAGRGRPKVQYHISAHPRLFAAFEVERRQEQNTTPEEKDDSAALRADDLAAAQLRAAAVEEYAARRYEMTETAAAISTVAAWQAAPRSRSVQWTERLAAGFTRRREREVVVGSFSVRTLREWAKDYLPARRLSSLAPRRKEKSGRDRAAVPGALLDLIAALASSTPRANVALAIEEARKHWGGEWPAVCQRTLLRRLRERDPARIADTLGKRGIATFRKEHSPDIERDWNQAGLNDEWQLDDITEDFYGHSAEDPLRIVRPFAYAIIRCSTREWLAAVATETPLTREQVRPMLGYALASPRCGVPKRIRFERGAVACDDYLQETLETLGILVRRTSMDGGRVYPGAAEDVAKGHFQGKGIVESNIRNHHNRNALAIGQVGADERHTAAARLDNIKNYARACAKAGRPSILPTEKQWKNMIFQALENHNTRPHGALPEIALPDGTVRHMTPSERAASMDETLYVMPESYLPIFIARGVSARVEKNGVRFGGATYGRFDEELAALQGRLVTVYGAPDIAGAVFIEQLGRCVEKDEPVAPGLEGDLIERKRGIERAHRSQFEALMERVAQSGKSADLEALRVTRDPTPNRARETMTVPALADRARGLLQARDRLASTRAASAARFEVDADGAKPEERRGLLANADRFAAHAAAVADEPESPLAGLV